MVVSGSFGLFQILVKLQLGSGYVRDGFVIFDKKFLVKITFSGRFGVGSGGFGWFRWFRWFRGVPLVSDGFGWFREPIRAISGWVRGVRMVSGCFCFIPANNLIGVKRRHSKVHKLTPNSKRQGISPLKFRFDL